MPEPEAKVVSGGISSQAQFRRKCTAHRRLDFGASPQNRADLDAAVILSIPNLTGSQSTQRELDDSEVGRYERRTKTTRSTTCYGGLRGFGSMRLSCVRWACVYNKGLASLAASGYELLGPLRGSSHSQLANVDTHQNGNTSWKMGPGPRLEFVILKGRAAGQPPRDWPARPIECQNLAG